MTEGAAPLLAGIRVIELAQNLAGPFAGQILAQLGAEIIKVDRDMAEMACDPQVAALGIVEDVPGTPVRAVGLPLSIDGDRPRAQGGVPRAGEHTARLRPAQQSVA